MIANTDKKPLYIELYLKLRSSIISGEYPAGSRLPSEKELADEHGVSRITSRHALDRLAAEGLISRHPGKGSYILASPGGSSEAPAPSKSGSRLIGVVMESMYDHFGGGILLGLEKVCAEAGYSPVVKFSRRDAERELACIDELLAAGAEGIVLMCTSSEVYNSRVLKLSLDGFPLVFIDRSLNGLPVPYVGTDHYAAAKQLTCELAKQGHRNIAMATDEDSCVASSVVDREQGFLHGSIENKLFSSNRHLQLVKENAGVPDPDIHKKNIRLISEYLEKYPETSAIMAMSSEIVLSLLEAMNAGCKKFTIAFFDGPFDIPFVAASSCDMLCIKQDQENIGATACRLVMDIISGKKVPMSTTIPHIICT